MTSEPQLTVPVFFAVRCVGSVDDGALVGGGTITADEDVVGNGLGKDFDLEYVCDDLFCFAIGVGVHECNVVVGGDDGASAEAP